jgi:TonB family protein
MSSSFSPKNLPEFPTSDRLEQVVAILRQPIALAAFASFGVHGILWAALPLLPKPANQIEGTRSVRVVELTAAERLRLPQGDALPNLPLTSPYKLPNPSAGRSPFIPDSSSFYNSPRNPSNDPAGSPNTGAAQEPGDRQTQQPEIPINPGDPNTVDPRQSAPTTQEQWNADDYARALEEFRRNNPEQAPDPQETPSPQPSSQTPPSPSSQPGNNPTPGQNPDPPGSPSTTPGTTVPNPGLPQPGRDRLAQIQKEMEEKYGENPTNSSVEVDFPRNVKQLQQSPEAGSNFKQDYDPQYIPEPPYPRDREACRRRLQGYASVGALVGADGSILKVALLKSSKYKVLNDAAIADVEKRQFKPDGKNRTRLEVFNFDFKYPNEACDFSGQG